MRSVVKLDPRVGELGGPIDAVPRDRLCLEQDRPRARKVADSLEPACGRARDSNAQTIVKRIHLRAALRKVDAVDGQGGDVIVMLER